MKEWLWSIFGNDDDWPPPAWFYKKHTAPWWPDWFSKGVWLFWRNPLHNFMTYRIGLKGCKFTSVGKLPKHNYLFPKTGMIDGQFRLIGGWNYAIRYCEGDSIPYPFISYIWFGRKWKFRFNMGWRDNGAFNPLTLQLKRRFV